MSKSAGPQVLLLDPNFVSRVALSTRLDEAGCQVRAEKDFGVAAGVARGQAWDLILVNTGISLGDLKVFLEGMLGLEPSPVVAVVCEAGDGERQKLAEEMKVRTLPHPVRPSSLKTVFDVKGQQGTSAKWLPIVPKLEEPGAPGGKV